MPGEDIHPARCSQLHHPLVNWTLPQKTRAVLPAPLPAPAAGTWGCSLRREHLARRSLANGWVWMLALAGQATEGRGRASLPVPLLVPSRFYPAKQSLPCLRSSPPLQPPQAGSLAASLPAPGWGLGPAELCAGLVWAVLCLSLKASCLGLSTICDALGAAPSSSLSVRAEDVP